MQTKDRRADGDTEETDGTIEAGNQPPFTAGDSRSDQGIQGWQDKSGSQAHQDCGGYTQEEPGKNREEKDPGGDEKKPAKD